MKKRNQLISLLLSAAIMMSMFVIGAVTTVSGADKLVASDTLYYGWSNHWYSKTEGWNSTAQNISGFVPFTKGGVATYDLEEFSSQQINTNWSLNSVSSLKSQTDKALAAAKAGSGKLIFTVNIELCKTVGDKASGIYLKHKINGVWTGDYDYYLAEGVTKDIIIDVSELETAPNDFGMMLMNFNTNITRFKATFSPITVAVSDAPTTVTTAEPTTIPTTVPPTTAKPVIYGDSNMDNSVNAKDLLMLRQHLADWTVNIDLVASDVAYDNTVNAKDVLRLKQFFADWKVILGPETPVTTTAPATTSPITTTDPATTTGAPTLTTYTMSELADSMNMVGRGIVSGSKVKMEMTASGFEFKANCSGDVKADFIWQGGAGLVGVIIDGDFDGMQTIKVTADDDYIPLATGLAQGTHTIRVVKLNEFQQNQITISKIIMNGTKAGEKPAQKALKLEFYGDSITCGYGNLSTDHTSPYSTPGKSFNDLENGYRTYAAYTANALNAEFSVCAWSGCGIKYSYNGSETQVIGSVWDYATKTASQVKWDFTSYVADVVVVNMGTNDISYSKNSKLKLDVAEMTASCKKIIDNIRSVNPTAKIVWIGGMNCNYKGEYIDLNAILTGLTKEYDNLWFKDDFYTGQNGGDWHPSQADHKAVAAKLVTYLSEIIK